MEIEEISQIREKIRRYVQDSVSEKSQEDYRRIMAIFSRLNDLDDELMEYEAVGFLDKDSDWIRYVCANKLPKIAKELKEIDPVFFDI